MPNKIHAWESEKFTAAAKGTFISNLQRVIPEDEINQNGFDTLFEWATDAIGQTVQGQEERAAECDRLIEADDNGVLHLPSGWVRLAGVTDQRGVDAMNRLSESFATLLMSQSKKRKDPRIKQVYSDLAFLVDSNNGNYVQLLAESPHLNPLLSANIYFVNPKVFSSAEQKAGLGVPLYETIYDFRHAITNEARVEYHKQRLDAEGWTPANTKEYMRELLAAHKETLKQYTKLSSFSDTPQKIEKKYMGNSLSEILGRGENEHREINKYVGIIRGEKQAIENGWGKDELFILGSIGFIEEYLQKEEKYGSQEIKNSMPEFKSAFMKLKQECFYTRVGSGAQKAEITAKVREFLNTYSAENASPAARICTSFLAKNLIIKFEQAEAAVNEAVNKDQLSGTTFETTVLNNPAAYLQEQIDAANASGDYRQALLEYMYLEELVWKNIPDENDPRRVEFDRVVDAMKDQNNPNMLKLYDAMIEVYHEKMIDMGQAVEQLAADIREGRHPVDEQYDHIKTNYRFSMRYAKRLLYKSPMNDHLSKIAQQYTNQAGIVENITDSLQYTEKQHNKFFENATDSHSYAERMLLYKGMLQYDMNTFGADDNSLVKALRDDSKKINEYEKKVDSAADIAKNHFRELGRLASAKKSAVFDVIQKKFLDSNDPTVEVKLSDANSQSFMNMYNALEKVQELSSRNASPKELCEAYHKLDVDAKAYEDKINSQTFAAISTNGRQRKTLSQDLQTFAKEQLEILLEVPENIQFDKSLEAQKNELHEMTQSNRERLKPAIQEKINTQIANIKEENIVNFNPEQSFEENKALLAKGVANLILLVNFDKALNANPGRLLCENDISAESLSAGVEEMTRTKPQFVAMVEDIQTLEDYNKVYNMAKDNPKLLIDHLNKYAQKAPERNAADNNIIRPEKSGPVKGM